MPRSPSEDACPVEAPANCTVMLAVFRGESRESNEEGTREATGDLLLAAPERRRGVRLRFNRSPRSVTTGLPSSGSPVSPAERSSGSCQVSCTRDNLTNSSWQGWRSSTSVAN